MILYLTIVYVIALYSSVLIYPAAANQLYAVYGFFFRRPVSHTKCHSLIYKAMDIPKQTMFESYHINAGTCNIHKGH
jgi:hypothetical protein